MNNELGDDEWWRDVNKIESIKENMWEQTIQIMQLKKGKKEWGEQNFSKLTIDP
jgi:hypothetical protein